MLSIIGAINIDVIATALSTYHTHDSNPAMVTLSVGGVAMNYAHNLRLLGQQVQFFTAFSDDALAPMARHKCDSLGIDTSYACTITGAQANLFVGIHNAQGELESAACDAYLTEQYVNPDYLSRHIDVINSSALVMVDANLSVAALTYLFDHVQVPLMIDGVSRAKTERIAQALQQCLHPHIHTLKLNQQEYEVFLPSIGLIHLADVVEHLLVSKGAAGVDYYPSPPSPLHPSPLTFPALQAKQVVSTLGAGDAFLSGWAYAYLQGYALDRSMECAQSLAVHTLAVADSVNSSQLPSIFFTL